jgi:hypothetical protein
MNITIDIPSANSLSMESWRFWVSDSFRSTTGISAVLDSYTTSRRPSMRHKFRIEQKWERLNARARRYPGDGLLGTPPEMPQFVRDEVMKQINQSIVFVVETSSP